MRSVQLLMAATLMAVALTSGPVTATPAASQGSAVPPPASGSRAGHPTEGTMELRDAYLDADRSQSLRDSSPGVLARPSDSADGPGAVVWDPAAAQARACGPQLCINYVTTTSDAPPMTASDGVTPDWVRRNLEVAQLSLARMVELGYPRPPTDGGRGGGDQFDVYLADISRAGLYGYCAPEAPVVGAPGHASSFCVLDNDFEGFPMPPDESLRVTAAHELFHAVQFGMDVHEDRWFLESTATWMEEQVADDVNDNRQFLAAGQLAERRTPLDLSSGDLGSYGNWIFFQFLAQRHGVDAVRQIWALADSGPGRRDDFSVEAVRHLIESRGSSMKKVYMAFAAANLTPRRAYDEGATYRDAGFDDTVRLGPQRGVWREPGIGVPHLSSRATALRPLPGLRAGSRVRIDVDARRTAGAAATALVFLKSGTVVRAPLRLDGRGQATRFVGFSHSRVRRVVVLLVNASTRYECRRQTQFACQGKPTDDRQRFRVSAKVLR